MAGTVPLIGSTAEVPAAALTWAQSPSPILLNPVLILPLFIFQPGAGHLALVIYGVSVPRYLGASEGFVRRALQAREGPVQLSGQVIADDLRLSVLISSC
jgi:hypothetical protein